MSARIKTALFFPLVVGIAIGVLVTGNLGLASPFQDQDPQDALPRGRTASPIVDGQYPASYFPNTELLGPAEMRITALGTGMPNQTKRAVSISYLVELGNGEKFLFDIGMGAMGNLFSLRPDFSKIDKVFASHLHVDHVGDFMGLHIGSWLSGRYTPIHMYGPSGETPALGTKAFIEAMKTGYAWDIATRTGALPDAGGQIVVHEFNYLQENGLDTAAYEQALWGKIVAPLVTAVMVFIAIPFVFGPLRSVGVGHRILPGALAGIGFYILNQMFAYMGIVFGLNPVLSALAPAGIAFGAGYFMLRRVN